MVNVVEVSHVAGVVSHCAESGTIDQEKCTISLKKRMRYSASGKDINRPVLHINTTTADSNITTES